MIVLISFAFLAGLATALAPCILPVLPILLSGGAIHGRSRPWGIIAGVILSFSIVTLTLSWLVSTAGFSPNSARNFGVALLVALGILMLIPGWLDQFEAWIGRRLARRSAPTEANGFGGGLLLGLSLGAVWTPCAGPILASVITVAAAGTLSGEAAMITVAYGIGAAIPMGLIAALGQKAYQRLRFFTVYSRNIQIIFGAIILIIAGLMAFNLDRTIQAAALRAAPSWVHSLQRFEERAPLQQSGGFCPLGDACQ